MANGDITGYKLYYIIDRNSDNVDADMKEISDPSQSEYRIDGLEVYTEYRVWMKASTLVGDGPNSNPVTGRTGQSGESV